MKKSYIHFDVHPSTMIVLLNVCFHSFKNQISINNYCALTNNRQQRYNCLVDQLGNSKYFSNSSRYYNVLSEVFCKKKYQW